MPSLIDQLVDLGILSGEDRSKVVAEIGADQTDSNVVLDRLGRQRLLTEFQRAEIKAGRIGEFVAGDYVKLDPLGQGGMGAVYQARRRGAEDLVAIKVLPPALQADADALRRLRRELKAAAELRHPNIIQTFALEDTSQGPVLVMEYVEGTNLHELVRRSGPLPLETAMDCLTQAAAGLGHAHDHGVIHRDVKPSNLLLGQDGQLRVLDFGIARLAQGATDGAATTLSQLTQTGAVLGTVDFMAPEQAFDSKSVDARADIYSLSCTLYFLLHGTPPFHGETAVETLLAHNEAEVPALAIRGPRRLRKGLERFYRKMLAKKPENRFQSMGEVLAELTRLQEAVATSQARARHAVTAALLALTAVSVIFAGALAQDRLLPSPRLADSTVPASVTGSPATSPARSAPARPAWSALGWEPGVEECGIPGLIPRPATLSGLETWQLETRQPRTEITAMAWSRDARRLYYGTLVGQLWVYDLIDRKVLGIHPVHAGAVTAIAVHPNDQLVATLGAGDDVIRWWNRDFQPGPVLVAHRSGVTSIAWSPDGKTLVSGGGDARVRFWNEKGEPGRTLRGHEGTVRSLAWRPDGIKLASAGADKTIRIWNANGGQDKVLSGHDGEVRSIAWHPTEDKLLSGGTDKQVRIWDLTTGNDQVVEGHEFAVHRVGWSPRGDLFASLTVQPNSRLRIWNVTDTSRDVTSTRDVTAFAWHEGNFLLATGDVAATVRLSGADGIQYLEINSPHRFGHTRALHWRADGQRFASSHTDGTVRIWDRDGRLRKTMTGHEGWVESVHWSPDGSKLASAGHDQTVRVWNDQGMHVKTFVGHEHVVAVYGLAWSPDSLWVGSASYDGTVRLWSLAGEKHRILRGHQGRVQSLDWSFAADRLASVDDLAVIRLWRPGGEMTAEWKAAGGGIGTVSWSLDGQTLASISRAQVQLWDRTGKLAKESRIDGNLLQWSPSGDRLIVGGGRETTIWRPVDDGRKARIKHYRQAYAFAWHPTEDLVLTSGPDGLICAWNPTTGETRWVSIILDGDEYATFLPNGTLLAGSPRAVDRHAVVLARDTSGRTELTQVSDFFRRYGINIYE